MLKPSVQNAVLQHQTAPISPASMGLRLHLPPIEHSNNGSSSSSQKKNNNNFHLLECVSFSCVSQFRPPLQLIASPSAEEVRT